MARSTAVSPVHVYVYYKLGANRDAAFRTVTGMFAEIEARTGVAGRLLMRCDDEETWMEVYRDIRAAAAFRAVLDDVAGRLGVADLARDGARHVECFTPVAKPQDL